MEGILLNIKALRALRWVDWSIPIKKWPVIPTGAFDRNEMEGNGVVEESLKLIDSAREITFGEKVPPLRHHHFASLHDGCSCRNDEWVILVGKNPPLRYPHFASLYNTASIGTMNGILECIF